MTKFSEMTYQRPAFDTLFQQGKELIKKLREASSEAEFLGALKELDQQRRHLYTQATLCEIRHTIDTRDSFYNQEQDAMDQEMPRFGEIETAAAEAILQSPYRETLREKYGDYFLEKLALREKTFCPEIVEDLVQENTLSSQYDKLIASAQIPFEGKVLNLSGLSPFRQSTDREMRKKATAAYWGWFAQHQEELDRIYDELVHVRDRIGKKLGFKNFIPVAYARLGRTDWTQQEAKAYRQQIAESVVPVTQKLIQEQGQRIGIKDLKHYDLNLKYLSGNPKPQGEEPYLVEQALDMYHQLSQETGAFFQTMVQDELMSLTTAEGKSSGGYMTFLPDYKVPFIFSNFNGTSGDVDVLTHEAGHAFQGWLQRETELLYLTEFTQEVAETHSMSMEFFTHPWMEKFFGADTEKYNHAHVTEAIEFLPYGASVDEFQEWVYENPTATPAERNAHYREIQRKYQPHLDYDHCDYLESGARWQAQGHIYGVPFYYLDYTLSQVCAFQYFVWDRENHEAAWDSYMKFCLEAGEKPFTQMVQETGLMNPFQQGTIDAVMPKLEAYLNQLDHTKIH